LGIKRDGNSVIFDDTAPLANVRKAMTQEVRPQEIGKDLN
jgi:hypothetical protein